MGADIHFVIEEQYGDKWVGVFKTGCRFTTPNHDKPSNAELLWMRNYPFFALLAQVRSSGPGSEPPRGLPEDLSDLAEYELRYWGKDAHSGSRHTLEEFVKKFLCARDETDIAKTLQERLRGKNPVHEFFPRVPRVLWPRHRVIFWFDN